MNLGKIFSRLLTIIVILFFAVMVVKDVNAADMTVDGKLTVKNDLTALYPIYAYGNNIFFKGDAEMITQMDFGSSVRRIKSNDNGMSIYTYSDLHLDNGGFLYIHNKSSFGDSADFTNGLLLRGIEVTASANNINILKDTPVTSTEFTYLHGVTSAIQTQLDSKMGTSGGNLSLSGTLNVAGAATFQSTVAFSSVLNADYGIASQSTDLTIEAGSVTPKSLILVSDEATTDAINIDATAGGIDIDSDGSTINITSSPDAAGEDFVINMDSNIDASLVLQSSGTAADALQFISVNGGIDIIAMSATAGEDIDIATSGSSVNIQSTEDDANSIVLNSTAGGVVINLGGAAADDLLVDTDTLVVESDVNQVGIGVSNPEAKLEIEIDGTEAMTGLLIDQNDLDQIGLQISSYPGATETMLDLKTSSRAGDIINLDWTGGETQTAALTGIDLDFSNLTSLAGSTTYGLHINDLAVQTTSTEYAIYQEGTNWDYGLYLADDMYSGGTSIFNNTIHFTSSQNQVLDINAAAAGVVGKALTVISGAAGTASTVGIAGGAMTINSGAASNAVDGAGANGGLTTIASGDGSNAVAAGDNDGGNGGNVILQPGSGGTATGAGEAGEDGNIYFDTSNYVYFGGTSAALGDYRIDNAGSVSVWSKYVENQSGGATINACDAVQYLISTDAGYDASKVGSQVTNATNDGESQRFAGITGGDSIAAGASGWIIIYGPAGEKDGADIEGPVDGDANAAAGNGFVPDATDGAIRKTVANTDDSNGYFAEKDGDSNMWIVFVHGM